MPEPLPLTGGLLSASGNVDAFMAHGYIVLTGVDARDGRGVALELTKSDGIELMEWLSRVTA